MGGNLGDVFDADGVVWRPISPRLAAVRRTRLVLANVVAVIVLGALGIWVSPWFRLGIAFCLADLVGGYWLIGRQVRSWAYAERAEDLLIRHGVMFRELVVVPYGRMQFVDVQAGPLDRAFGVAHVQLHTASTGTDARIPGVGGDEAGRLRDRLASRGEARMAGL